MLSCLNIRNYALIKELTIEFAEGLNIITGETGAGKSILLGALSLILGNRSDTTAILDKQNKCIIEGEFNVSKYQLQSFFEANELEYCDTTFLRREIYPNGKSRAFINDSPVSLGLLKELGGKLIDIHSQHQTLLLNDSPLQLGILDIFANTCEQVETFSTKFSAYKKEIALLEERKNVASKNRGEYDYSLFQLNQLDETKLVNGEYEEIEAEVELLNHAEEIKNSLLLSIGYLSSDNNSILSILKIVRNIVGKISKFPNIDKELTERIESCFIELSDINLTIEKIAEKINDDPKRQQQLNERLDILNNLMHKHQVADINELIEVREKFRQIVNNISTDDKYIAELENSIALQKNELEQLAAELSYKRCLAAKPISEKVETILHQLGMPNARFVINVSSSDKLTPTGNNYVDFLFSANKNIAPELLEKAASGGELSRVMLSLKSLICSKNNLPTIIFDEIDSGVSGEVADKMGTIFATMGDDMQVICITHLPQVAAKGETHFFVFKDESGEVAETQIHKLNEKKRVNEIARLLSGSSLTTAAIDNAKSLLIK